MLSPIKPMPQTRAGIFTAAAGLLAEAGIPPLLMRDDMATIGELLEIDVLVPRDTLDAAAAMLIANGWELLDSGLFHACKRALVTYHDGDLLKFDLHGEVIDNGLVYLSNGDMFEGARDSGSFFLLPRDESWIAHTVFHSILGKPVVPPKLRAGMVARLNGQLNFDLLRAIARPYGLEAPLDTALSHIVGQAAFDDVGTLARLRAEVRRRLLRSPANLLRRARLRAVWAVGQALGWRPGILIAFIGPDGAGKSSTIDAMAAHLSRLLIPTRKIYLGPWDRHLLPTSRHLYKLRAGPRDDVRNLDPALSPLVRTKKWLAAQVKRTLYYSNIFLEIWARYLRHVLPHLALRRIVLADRYAYDLEIGHFNHEVTAWRPVRNLVVRLYPVPDFLILLDNDAETIWARKKEYKLDVIRAVLERYRALGRRRGAVIMRTNRPSPEVVRQFLETHWRTIIRLRRDRIRFWRL